MSSEDHVSIEGTLLMLDDTTPHVAVPVQVMRDGEVITTTLSDESGRYQLINLRPGRYLLRCQALDGYIYYGQTAVTQVFSPVRDKGGTSEICAAEQCETVQVESDRTLRNINFRFAPFKKGMWKTYNYLDGLADNFVRAIYCDLDGVLWFGTEDGVSRYDGKEFANLTTEDGLADNDVWSIHQDADGLIWFGTGDGGVSKYDGKEFVNFTTEDGLAHNSVEAIYSGPDGVVWFGTGGGVSQYDGKEFANLTTKDGLVDDYVRAICRDLDGVMWFGTNKGVSRYDGKEFVNFTTEDGLASNRVRCIHQDPDGVMWFGTNDGGVSQYDGKKFVNFTTEDGLVNNSVLCIHQCSDNVLWFGTKSNGVSRYDGKRFINFTTKDGLVNNRVNAIHRDPSGAMWFSTEGFGVSRYDPNEFNNLTVKDGLVNNSTLCIHQDPDGVIWFGTGFWMGGGTGGGLSRYDGNRFVNFTTEDGLAHSCIRSIHRDADGIMWFGTGGGISHYDGREFANFTTKDGLADNRVCATHRDAGGIMWFGTGWWTDGSGVSRYDGKRFVNFTTEDGLVNNSVWCIHQDPDGVMWFGTGGGGISQYDGKRFVNLTIKDGLVNNSVWCIHQDPDGVMWFGTGGGISRYDGKEFVNFTTEDGLVENGIILAIHREPNGVMWFGTESGGVSGYDGAAWTSLDTRDGLAGNRVESILQDSDGFLWFATEGGVTRYRRNTTPPKAYMVSVTTDRTYSDLSAIPAFTPGTRVTTEYSSIDFKTIPEKRQYRCRIKEIDSDWRKPTKETSLDFIFDKPGTYTFEVQAIDRDLNYSDPASVKLQVIADPRNHQIAQLRGELAERERAEMERMQQELEDARQIQQSLLPEKPPRVEGFEMAGTSLPAREVSGDFYDYLSLGRDVGIVLADVTGKSVQAAMVAAMANGMLHRGLRDISDSPGEIFRGLNMDLQPRLTHTIFTAMSLGILQVEQNRLLFSNAGMPYPIVKRGRQVRELMVNGLPLGITDAAEYDDLSVDLEDGDFVVFYSDGVIEAENEAGEMYQTERLLEVVQEASPALSAQEMVDLIVSDVTAFVGDVEPSDDITVVVLRCIE